MSLPAFRGVAALRGVGMAGRLVLYALADHHNGKTGLCAPGTQTIADHAGITRRSVTRALDDLAKAGLIRILPGSGIKTGSGATNAYHLLFDFPSDDEAARGDSVTPRGDSVSERGDAESHKPGSNQELKPQDAHPRESSDEPVDLDLAVEIIWRAVGDFGRKRSSKPKIKTALAAALKRRPAGVGEEAWLERILKGIRAYLADPDTRKEGGKYEHGAHRTLEGDVWQTYLEMAEGSDPDAVDPEMGTTLEPGPKLQRYWAELCAQGMPWDLSRGPRPEMPGCRISPEIQREFGFVPYEDAPPEKTGYEAEPSDPAPLDPAETESPAFNADDEVI